MITVSGCVSPTIAGAMNLNEVSEHLFPVTAVQGRLLHRRICNLYKRKQENLPTQVGLDVLQSDLDTRSLRLFLQLFQATILRVRTDTRLSVSCRRAAPAVWRERNRGQKKKLSSDPFRDERVLSKSRRPCILPFGPIRAK